MCRSTDHTAHCILYQNRPNLISHAYTYRIHSVWCVIIAYLDSCHLKSDGPSCNYKHDNLSPIVLSGCIRVGHHQRLTQSCPHSLAVKTYQNHYPCLGRLFPGISPNSLPALGRHSKTKQGERWIRTFRVMGPGQQDADQYRTQWWELVQDPPFALDSDPQYVPARPHFHRS